MTAPALIVEVIVRRCCETQMDEMEIEQNTISRDWIVVHDGRKFLVSFANSDAQMLGLCNRDNWKIREETEDDIEEFNADASDSSLEEQTKTQEDAEMMDRLIGFCLGHWEHEVGRELTENMEMQRRRPDG